VRDSYKANSFTAGRADIPDQLLHQTHNTTGDFYSTHQLLGVTVISCEFLQSEEMAEKEEPREEVVNETITLKVRDQAGEEMFFKVTNQSQD
jgi:hypothetical protein